MRQNRAARFGKQANHEKRGKTSIRHRDQVKQQQKKNNQTNKEGGAKNRKRRHYCKANHAYECIKRFQNCFLVRFRLFFSPRVSCVISYLLDAMLLPPQQLKLKQPVIKCHHYNKQNVSLTDSRSFQVAK